MNTQTQTQQTEKCFNLTDFINFKEKRLEVDNMIKSDKVFFEFRNYTKEGYEPVWVLNNLTHLHGEILTRLFSGNDSKREFLVDAAYNVFPLIDIILHTYKTIEKLESQVLEMHRQQCRLMQPYKTITNESMRQCGELIRIAKLNMQLVYLSIGLPLEVVGESLDRCGDIYGQLKYRVLERSIEWDIDRMRHIYESDNRKKELEEKKIYECVDMSDSDEDIEIPRKNQSKLKRKRERVQDVLNKHTKYV